jgi:hypothetical protein
MSNILLIAMGLFFIVPTIIYKEYFLSLVFVIFGLVFGFVEFLAKTYTGQTVSQQVWALIVSNSVKGYILIGCMALGWACLLAHLSIRFK